jgi:hypothetical protein
MTMNTTVELTVVEVEILLSAATRDWRNWAEHRHDGDKNGWYDAKERDRVLTREHQTGELVAKLQTKLKEMLDG